jgi:hypothetical protein
MTLGKRQLLISFALLLWISILGWSKPPEKRESINGMTISCQTWGWEWGTDEMVEAMRELKTLGVNWMAIHPYASIRRDGSVRSWRMESGAQLDWLTRPIEEAHRLGLKILIKPHLAYWGSGFRWRGEINFNEDEEWERFFSSYEEWIRNLAKICSDADAFVIGTELDGTVHFDTQWRKIIQVLREESDAPITYAANWTDYERISFWDMLDAIGIQAYFPLTNSSEPPDEKLLANSWKRKLRELNKFARKHNRPIVFTEIGYDVSTQAARKPWERGDRKPSGEEIQKLCLKSALSALAEDDEVIGAFLWKWFPGNPRREDFLASTPAMKQIIKEHWLTTPSVSSE